MSLEQILIGGILLAFVIGLIRAAHVLSENPYQQIRAHEDLTGKLDGSIANKQRLINWLGISPANSQRVLWLIAAVIAFAALTIFVA